MDESRPNSSDFDVIYDTVFGEFDPKVDYIRATDSNGHYERLWVSEFGQNVKVPPRIIFMIEKVIASPNNKLRSRNDVMRDALVREFHWRMQQEKDLDLTLTIELEAYVHELALESALASVERDLANDKEHRDGILRILSDSYSPEVEAIAVKMIAILKNPDYVRECNYRLDCFRSGPQRR